MVDPARPRAVLMMARAPRAEFAGANELGQLLGPERWVALGELLISRATAWATEVAPGAVHVAYEPADAGAQLQALLGPDVDAFAQTGAGPGERLANAVDHAFASGGGGPVLIAWPDLPRWPPELGASALADLRDGCGVSVGPVFDGGLYLIALAGPLPALFELPDHTWRSPDALAIALSAAHAAGVDGGLLRAERGLHSPEDVRAALADPLLDPELRRLLDTVE